MKSTSVPSYFVHAILKNTQKTDTYRSNLLKKHKIARKVLVSEGARLPASQFANLQHEITQKLQDETLGYFERPLPVGTFAMGCHSLIHSTTIGSAMHRYCQFYQLVDRGLIPYLVADKTQFSIYLRPKAPSFNYDHYAYESCLYYPHRLLNWLGNTHVHPEKIHFHYDMPSHVAEYRPLFFGAPVFFNQSRTELFFKSSALNIKVEQNPRSISSFLNKAIFEMLVQDYESTLLAHRVKKIVNNDLEKIPTLEDIAKSFRLHPQTLRRRLHSEGTSFQELKNECRRDYAIYRLSRSEDSVEEIAQKVGYSEPSTFIRAFKVWTGTTPLSYRRLE